MMFGLPHPLPSRQRIEDILAEIGVSSSGTYIYQTSLEVDIGVTVETSQDGKILRISFEPIIPPHSAELSIEKVMTAIMEVQKQLFVDMEARS